MDIKQLKNNIENKNLDIGFFIFKYKDINFLPNQYVFAISNILNLDITYLDSLSNITHNNNILFTTVSDSLNIYKTTIFDYEDNNLKNQKNLIVICKDIDESCRLIFQENIINFPKIENWQIKDYIYSISEGVDTKYLDSLIELYSWDIFRLDNEISKIKIFDSNIRNSVFKSFIDDGLFNDVSNNTIFDFSNALLRKDIYSLTKLYKEIEKIDCEPLRLVTILYKSIRNIILIQLDKSATPESTKLPSNRFWAIKKNVCGFYNKDQLLKIFDLITSIDKKLKTGEISTNTIIDYIVCKMLSF